MRDEEGALGPSTTSCTLSRLHSPRPTPLPAPRVCQPLCVKLSMLTSASSFEVICLAKPNSSCRQTSHISGLRVQLQLVLPVYSVGNGSCNYDLLHDLLSPRILNLIIFNPVYLYSELLPASLVRDEAMSDFEG